MNILAPVEYGINFERGTTHYALNTKTFPNYPSPIGWSGESGSVGTAEIYPDTSTGALNFVTHNGNVSFGSNTNGNQRVTLDTSLITNTRTFKLPNSSGTFLTNTDINNVKVSRQLPAAVNDEVHIGSFDFSIVGTGASFDIYVDYGLRSKRYTFNSVYGTTMGNWVRSTRLLKP